MKKLLVVLVVLVVGTPAFAQTNDGFDWVKWSRVEKLTFVMGVFDTLVAMNQMFVEGGASQDYADSLTYIPGTVGDLVDEIDAIYSDYQVRPAPVIMAILMITGLYDYWYPTQALLMSDDQS